MPNQQVAEELHKPIIKKILEKNSILIIQRQYLGVDLTYMQLISKFNKGVRFLFCVIDIFSKYAWVVPLKKAGFLLMHFKRS